MVYHYAVAWRIDGVHLPKYFLPTMSHVAVYGFLGVEVFFVISGFVICMSSWGRRLGDFFTSRVSRLYPAYWIAVLLTSLVAVLVPLRGGIWGLVDPAPDTLAVNMTMVQEPLGVGSIDAVSWTLFVELRFYLLFVVPVMLGLTYRRALLFCAAWTAVSVLSPVLASPLLNTLVVPEYTPYFVAGILMYLIHRFGPSPLLFGMIAFNWLLSLHAVTGRVQALGGHDPAWPASLIITAAYLIILAIALGWLDRLRWPWLTTAGALTYPLYLLHQRIGYTVIRTVYFAVKPPVWLLLTATAVLMLVLSWLVHRFVEKPLTAYLRRTVGSSLDQMRSACAPAEVPRIDSPLPAPQGPTTGVVGAVGGGKLVLEAGQLPERGGRGRGRPQEVSASPELLMVMF